MKRDLVVAGKGLAGAGLTGAVLYLVATASTHVRLLWPYGIFLAMVLVGVVLYLTGQERAPAEPEHPGPPVDPVVVGEIPREPAAFVARATVDRLAAAAGSGQVAVLCAVTGLRGVGKTQVAAAYARDRIAAGWGLVGWVNAESRDVLLAGLARGAAAVGVADPEGDSAESARRLREHLETRASSSLLVLDNAACRTWCGRSCPLRAARRSW